MHMADPTFPPLLNGHSVKSPMDHFSHAVSGAISGDFGAGDCIWSRNTHRFDCAIVLEPDDPLNISKQIMHVAMVAFGDAFGALAPPEVGAMYSWPGDLRINGALVGEVRLAVSPERGENDCPLWMVLGIGAEMAGQPENLDPGENPDETSFFEEGCGDITRSEMIESFCRHFLTWLHTWEEDGFAPIHRAWMERAEKHNREVSLTHNNQDLKGVFLGLDDGGDMLIKIGDETRLLSVELAMNPEGQGSVLGGENEA